MELTFSDIRKHYAGQKSFYWNVKTGETVPVKLVQKLAGSKYFFTPEQQRPTPCN